MSAFTGELEVYRAYGAPWRVACGDDAKTMARRLAREGQYDGKFSLSECCLKNENQPIGRRRSL
jgi:hypothetical protein